MRHFLFGYGSLINRESRRATGETGQAMPVSVQGMQRAWNVAAPQMQMVGVGIIPDKIATCNGLLVEIAESEIVSFDKREIEGTGFGYERVEIELKKIIGSSGELSKNMKVWAYIVKKSVVPSWKFPIAQSYVDVILSGCLDISEEFAVEFIRETIGWESPWCNDRSHPRYTRHLKKVEFQGKIDELLAQYTSLGFASRKDI